MLLNFFKSNFNYFRATTSVVAKICKIWKMFNFAYFNQKNTHINTCKNVEIYKTATVRLLFTYKWFFYSFFLSPPTSCSSPLSTSHNKTTKSPLPYPQPPISIFFQQQNHKTTPAQPQPQFKVLPPKYKTQKLKLVITHHKNSKNRREITWNSQLVRNKNRENTRKKKNNHTHKTISMWFSNLPTSIEL